MYSPPFHVYDPSRKLLVLLVKAKGDALLYIVLKRL